MNFKSVQKHQTIEEPEHIAENLTVFQSVLKDKKILTKPSIAFLDVAYIGNIDGICTQTAIVSQCDEEYSNKTFECKEPDCGEKFDDQLEFINHIQTSHIK